MPPRTRALDEAERRWQRLARDMADQLRAARHVLGVTQQAVADSIGVSQAEISRRERAILAGASVRDLAIHAAAVGLRLGASLWPVGGGLRDAGQLRYISAFVARVGRHWAVTLEALVPAAGDLRAADILLVSGHDRIVVEVITRLTDVQAQVRAARQKSRDIGATRLIVVVAATHANRSALAAARGALVGSFELDTRRVLSELTAGRDPGRDAVILLTA